MVGTEDRERIRETLDSLRSQVGGHGCEVILADRRNDALSHSLQAAYPGITVIPCPSRTPLPELRAIALEHATGDYAVVTEDHCVPPRDWLENIASAFGRAPPGTAAVGGCVENGVAGSAFDWATFLCEYSAFVAPVTEGDTQVLPGMNIAYDRAALQRFDRARLASGFWETTIHPELLKAGRTLYSANAIKIVHSKKFSLRLFASQRFLYSRYHAALRFEHEPQIKRLLAVAATPLLPPLLLFRMYRQVAAKKRLRAQFLSALPALAVFVIIWAAGEMVGYALGAGDALSRIE